MRVTVPGLVLAGLGMCYLGGQLERTVKSRHAAIGASVGRDLGIALDGIAVLVVAGLVMLVSYCRTGHPLPGHARPALLPPPRPRPGPTEYSVAITKLGDGVMAGPSIALVEAGEGEDVPVLPGAGEIGAAHLELAGKGSDESA